MANKTEAQRKEALAKLAEKMQLTQMMNASLAMFGREFETASAEQVRQALTDAYIVSSHRKIRDVDRQRGKNGNRFTQEELDDIRKIYETGGFNFNKSKR